MLFLYKLHISQSQHLEKRCQKNGEVSLGYNFPALTISLCYTPTAALAASCLFRDTTWCLTLTTSNTEFWISMPRPLPACLVTVKDTTVCAGGQIPNSSPPLTTRPRPSNPFANL